MAKRLLIFLLSTLCISACAHADTHDGWDGALDRSSAQLCQVPVVFLGEPGHHGSSAAIRFKSALAQRLIEHCSFNVLVFESPMYDFLDVDRRPVDERAMTKKTVLDAVGGIWSMTAEFQAFAQFIADQTAKKKLTLGGWTINCRVQASTHKGRCRRI